jgi:DNA/RNA endonuclease G (NUC1)
MSNFKTVILLALVALSIQGLSAPEDAYPATPGVVDKGLWRLKFDAARHQPAWEAWEITPSMRLVDNSRPDVSFKTDTGVEGAVSQSNYVNSGKSRGHVVPSNHFSFDVDWMKRTYTTSNIVPQDQVFNDRAWGDCEDEEFERAKRETVTIVAGTIHKPGEPDIGKDKIPVPAKMFRATRYRSHGNPERFSCYIFDNVPDTDRADNEVTLNAVRAATGVNFFPGARP